MPAPLVAALAPGLLQIGSEIVDALFETEEEKAAAKVKLMQAQLDGELKKSEIALSAILAEAKSSDPWTSRARPSFLYVMYALILTAIPMGILFAFKPDVAMDVSAGVQQWLAAIPEAMWGLFGVGYLGYTAGRSWDKNNQLKAFNGSK